MAENYELFVLRQLSTKAIEECTDTELLDLIYKLLIQGDK